MANPTVHRAKIAEARNVLGEVIARARFGGEPTILVNRGKEAAVIVSYDFYEQAASDRRKAVAFDAAMRELPPGERPQKFLQLMVKKLAELET